MELPSFINNKEDESKRRQKLLEMEFQAVLKKFIKRNHKRGVPLYFTAIETLSAIESLRKANEHGVERRMVVWCRSGLESTNL